MTVRARLLFRKDQTLEKVLLFVELFQLFMSKVFFWHVQVNNCLGTTP